MLRPTPTAVQVRIAAMKKERVPDAVVRSILRWRRRKYGSQTLKCTETQDDLSAFLSERKDPDGDQLFFAHVGFDPFMWVCILIPFLAALSRQHELYGLDTWCYTLVSAVIDRKIQHRWRRSCWPLLCVCSAQEHGLAYETAFQSLKAELMRRRIPLPTQVNLDYFEGSKNAAMKVFPKIWICQGLWHQRCNLLTPQASGDAAQRQTACRSQRRREALFHVARIEHVWGDSKWLSYYKTEYMSTRPAHNATAEGCQEFLHGSWWSGLSSRLLPGRPATQQPIEMLNSHFKRAMRSQRSLHSHIAVAMSLEDTVRAWSAPLAPMETDEKKLVSLMCPDDQVSLSRPRDPDRWMGTTGLCRRSPFGRLRFYPPIGPLLKRFKKRNSEYVQEVTTQNKDKTEQKWLLGGLGGYGLG
eukprot:s1190_g6.t1